MSLEIMGLATIYLHSLKEHTKTVLSISFEVGGSLLSERRRHELPRGVWGHAPPENFEI